MGRAPADSLNTILLKKNSIPLTSIFPSIFHWQFMAAVIAMIAVLADVLVIVIASVPYSAGQVVAELLASMWTTIVILALMIIGIISLIVWKARAPTLPRPPNTVGAVMSYVSDSRMAEDLEGCEYLNDFEIKTKIAGRGKKYLYGSFPGSDGEYKYFVDEKQSAAY
jgi:heme/copper-type cytochrome/quinol oxidase subunit 2